MQLAIGTMDAVQSRLPSCDYLDIKMGIDLGSHVNLRMGVDNLEDKAPSVIDFSANPLLANGNSGSLTYDTCGPYLFVGLIAKY